MVFDYTHHFKAEGTYRLPFWGGFNLSGIYRYITGAAWGRRAGIRDLDQGTETVRIEERGTRRVDALNNFDFRVEKTFVFGQQSRTAGVFVDIFNVNNQGIPDSDDSQPITDTSGAISESRATGSIRGSSGSVCALRSNRLKSPEAPPAPGGASGRCSRFAHDPRWRASVRHRRGPWPRLTPQDRAWLASVDHAITKQERKQYEALSEAERRSFQDAFWRSRDPNPETPQNEALEEYM